MQDASRDYNRKLRRRDGFCYPKDNETSGAARLLYSISFLLISIFRKNVKIGLIQHIILNIKVKAKDCTSVWRKQPKCVISSEVIHTLKDTQYLDVLSGFCTVLLAEIYSTAVLMER